MIRFGIIGAGRIAKKFAETFRDGLIKNASLEAVASADLSRAQAFAKECGVAKAYGGYGDLLSDEGIDAVYVATTNNTHLELCLKAIEAGKHVLCEKPLALNLSEAQTMFDAAASKGVFLMEAMWSVFLPPMVTAKQWIEQGKIGRILSVEAPLCFARSGSAYRRLYDPALGGGAMLDLGVYSLEIVDFLARPRKLLGVKSVSLKSDENVDIMNMAMLSYSDNFTAQIHCGFLFEGNNELILRGTQGWLRLSPKINAPSLLELFGYENSQNPKETFSYDTPSGFEFQVDHMAERIMDGALTSDVMTPEASLLCAKVTEKITAGDFSVFNL